mmetsp:Transcript_16488/g.35926  ORF Transcript_16488/g.35926 Transcript_16488/m.35926 type:complete len:266 (-) Transcript_16488:25-822(-)
MLCFVSCCCRQLLRHEQTRLHSIHLMGGKRKDDINVSELLVNHESEDSHLGGTSVVQFNGSLATLPVIGLLVPSEVKGSVTEVTLELGFALGITVTNSPRGLELILVGGFHHSPGGDQLCPNHTGEVVKGGESTRDVFGSRESDSSSGGQVTNNSKHGNTSVLELDPSKAVELFLVGILSIPNDSQRVEESQRCLNTNFSGNIGGQCGGSGRLLGRSEGSGTCDKGGENSELHDCSLFVLMMFKFGIVRRHGGVFVWREFWFCVA